MKKLTYGEKLKDPRWQKLRLELFNKAQFKCHTCQSPDKTLHVHHKYYKSKVDPWDYPEDAFIVLCSSCHEVHQKYLETAHELIGKNFWLPRSIAVASEEVGSESAFLASLEYFLDSIHAAFDSGFELGRKCVPKT